jgi:acetyltransferase-like isoleucine patch superfamily enzyme
MTVKPSLWKKDAPLIAAQRERGGDHPLARQIARLYRFVRLRSLVRRICLRLEGGPMFSVTWRHILQQAHEVTVGQYSYGDILAPGLLPQGTVVGRYCSVGTELIVRRRNHPTGRPFLHPFFYNRHLGLLAQDSIMDSRDNPLTIGHDVWIADRVTILPGCRSIGNGAVIGAGAVVSRDVPPYAVVAGTPARQIRMRFGSDRIAEIEASRWWERDIADLIRTPPVTGIFGPDPESPAHLR